MGKPRTKKAATLAEDEDADPTAPLVEETLFEPDEESSNAGKNRALAVLLGGPWKSLAIVRVERIEIGDSGWRVVHRE